MSTARRMMLVIAAASLILGCSLVSTPIPPEVESSTMAVATVAVPTSAPTAEPTPVPTDTPKGIPVNYKNVSFTIPSALAINAAPETVPVMTAEQGAPWEIAPEHIHFHLDGYSIPAGSFSAFDINVYPAREYGDANPGANISLQRLQGILSDPSLPLTTETLPQVPYFNAASMLSAQAGRLDFQNGRGVRLVTQYGQAVAPINNGGTFYHFQGLTSDEKYYVVVVLPIQAPFLQQSSDPSSPLPEGGIPFPGYDASDAQPFMDYFNAVAARMDATGPDQFSPSLSVLDALMQSLSVSP